MTIPFDIPPTLRPWLASLAVTGLVLAAALAVRAMVSPAVTDGLGTALLVAGAVVAGATTLGLLARERSVSPPVAVSLFLTALFVGLLVR